MVTVTLTNPEPSQDFMAREKFLAFALPDLDESEAAEILDTLTSGWITTGPKTHQFEQAFAAFVGAKHAIAVNSCTAAMHLALEAIGLKEGDEVITTPYTFAATAEVIRYFNAKPVFVDICANDFNINVEKIAAAITPKTKAIIPVHMTGVPTDLDAIYAIADAHGLSVIEDAAHSFPSKLNGRMVGTTTSDRYPSAICFSFYATKTITTAEGGMICTDSDALAERCRIMALHGISRDAWKRYTAAGTWFYSILAPGYKYNMTDIASSMGLAQLRKAERMWKRRCEIAERYNSAFSPCTALQIPFDAPSIQHAWHLYLIRLNPNLLTIDRARFIEELKLRNIGVSVHFIPLHIHPYYRETYGYMPDDFPVAHHEYQRVISLPIYSKMSDEDVQDVINSVLDIVTCFHV